MNSTNQTLKNVFVLGVVLLIIVVAWAYVEIIKSGKLIDLAQDPLTSIQRGTSDAREAFNSQYAHFKTFYIEGSNAEYPGVLTYEIEGKYKEFVPNSGWKCLTEVNLKSIALNLEEFEYNKHYVLAYNLELIRLLDDNKST